MLSSTSTASVILGILLQFLLGTFIRKWRTVAIANCVLPTLAFFLLFFVPESPHWLITRKRYSEAKSSLAWLRGWTTTEQIELEFKEIYDKYVKSPVNGVDNPAFEGEIHTSSETVHQEHSRLDALKNFTKKSFLWPYCLTSFIFFLCHFTGTTTLQTYAVQIFVTLRTPVDTYYATVIFGLVQVIGCVLCVTLIHYAGKRLLVFISLIGCGICMSVVAGYAQTLGADDLLTDTEADISKGDWIPTTLLIGGALFASMCIRSLPWILIGEVYPNDMRAFGSGLSAATNYVFSFISNKTFLSSLNSFTLPGTLGFYAGLSFLGCVALYFLLPETEGKTLMEITDHFEGTAKMDNKVRRKGRTADSAKDCESRF